MSITASSLAFLGLPGGMEWVVIAMIGLLLFGRRLPEIAKSMGKSVVEFKKGLRGVEEEIDRAGDQDMLPPPDKTQNNAPASPESRESRDKEEVSSGK
ncbi:MAG: hypothetical protein AMXMBFR83_29830 [Phycisphaerae bacterium]|jgi:sec-independent protein translocase protein TatA